MKWNPQNSSNLIPIGSWDTHSYFEAVSQYQFTPRPFRDDEPYLLRDQRMTEAIRLLSALNILQYQQFDLNDGFTHSRIIIYAIDDSSSGSNGSQSSQPEGNVKHALAMVLLNMNINPNTYQNPTTQGGVSSTIFQEDKSKRLLDIYLDMPSPRTENDPYMSPEVESPPLYIQNTLRKALRDCIPGMKTKLYGYQKNSLWKLLRRELCTNYIIGPTLFPATDMNGNAYFIDLTARIPKLSSKPLDRWEDVAGGVICEDMGTGKSCLCIALIVLTLDQISQPPATASHVYCETSSSELPIVFTQDVSVMGDSKGILLSPRSSVPSLRDLAAAAVKMGKIGYKEYSGHLSYDVEELLDSMSIYYHIENSPVNARTPRATRFRLMDQSLEVHLSYSTLVIVPPNLSDQWHNEINKHTQDNALRLLRIESDDKEIPDHKTLIQYDIVLITQNRFAMEYEPGAYSRKHSKGKTQCGCKEQYVTCRCPIPRTISPLMQVRWKRVIVDEGHSMGVKLSDHTLLAEKLHTDRRWICTGTPTFNLANLQPSSSLASSSASTSFSSVSSNHLPISDKGDLDRLGTLMTTFLQIQPYYDNKNLFHSALVKPLEEHHNINKQMSPNSSTEWSLESLSSVTRLRYLMDRIMIRNRPEDVMKDVSLPPLYERVVSLNLEYFQTLTMNCYVSIIQANAILSERVDQDYFFHPSNRKHLAQLTENLKDGCFWNPAGKDFQSTLRTTLENVNKAITRHQSNWRGIYPQNDFLFLINIRDHLNDILSSDEWKVIQETQEVGYYCENVPRSVQLSHALIPAEESLNNSTPDLPESGDPDQACVMLGNQILRLRTELQEIQINNSLQSSAPTSSHSTSRDQPIIIDLDPILEEQHPQGYPGSINMSIETASLHIRERNMEMTKERLSKSKIICSTSSKLNYIVSQILRHQNTEKCIIFCQGQTTMYYIKEYLALAKVRCLMYHTYGMTKRERSNNIMTFNTSENVSAIIMDVRSGAHGIDLSSASRVYFVSPVWRTDTMRQAVKRAHRIGQSRPVYVETLIIEGSIEEAILHRRNEIDSGIEPDTLSEPGPSQMSIQIHKPRGPKSKGILDDGGLVSFIQNISFMSVPARRSLSILGSPRYPGCMINLKDSWDPKHTYKDGLNEAAFTEDDERYMHLDSQNALIPIVFPNRNPTQEVEPFAPSSERYYVTVEDLSDSDSDQYQDCNVTVIDLDCEPTTSTQHIVIDDDDEADDKVDIKYDNQMQPGMLIDPYGGRANVESKMPFDWPGMDLDHEMKERKPGTPFTTTPSSNILERLDTLTLNSILKSEIKQENQLLQLQREVKSEKIKLQFEMGSPSIKAAESSRSIKSEIASCPKVEIKSDPFGILSKPEPEYYILYDEDEDETDQKVESKDDILSRTVIDNISLKSETKHPFDDDTNKRIFDTYHGIQHYKQEYKNNIIPKNEVEPNISSHIKAKSERFDVKSDLIGFENSRGNALLKRSSIIDRSNSEESGEGIESSNRTSSSNSKKVRFG